MLAAEIEAWVEVSIERFIVLLLVWNLFFSSDLRVSG
jgi:hypothetical protein